MKNLQTTLNKHANVKMPFAYIETDSGECFNFNSKQLVLVVIKTHKLEDIGKNMPLIFSIASDGVKITNNLDHFIAGFKVVDIIAIDLLKNILANLYTRDVCWPVRIV